MSIRFVGRAPEGERRRWPVKPAERRHPDCQASPRLFCLCAGGRPQQTRLEVRPCGTTKTLSRAADERPQPRGGNTSLEFPIAKIAADARIARIFGSPCAIMKMLIARSWRRSRGPGGRRGLLARWSGPTPTSTNEGPRLARPLAWGARPVGRPFPPPGDENQGRWRPQVLDGADRPRAARSLTPGTKEVPPRPPPGRCRIA
jgi:hypothetical protein